MKPRCSFCFRRKVRLVIHRDDIGLELCRQCMETIEALEEIGVLYVAAETVLEEVLPRGKTLVPRTFVEAVKEVERVLREGV